MSQDTPFDLQLLSDSINYHGEDLLRILQMDWPNKIQVYAIPNINYKLFESRFQEKGTLGFSHILALLQFISKKADMLLAHTPESTNSVIYNEELYKDRCNNQLPLEFFIVPPPALLDSIIYQSVEIGDFLYVTVIGPMPKSDTMTLRLISFASKKYLYTLNSNLFISKQRLLLRLEDTVVPKVDQSKGGLWLAGTKLRVKVIELSHGVIYVATKDDSTPNNCQSKDDSTPDIRPSNSDRLGKVVSADLPEFVRTTTLASQRCILDGLRNRVSFKNPLSIKELAPTLGVNLRSYPSLMPALRKEIPEMHTGSALRKVQARRWAHKCVAEGVASFKKGEYESAFQSLSKALQIDPENAEAFVAQGALLANLGRYEKAIKDFEKALEIDPTHSNAKKYLAETLVELGIQLKNDDKLFEAIGCFEKCIALCKDHPKANKELESAKRTILRSHANASDEEKKIYLFDLQHVEESLGEKDEDETDCEILEEGRPDSNADERPIEVVNTAKREESLSPFSKKMAMQENLWAPPLHIDQNSTFLLEPPPKIKTEPVNNDPPDAFDNKKLDLFRYRRNRPDSAEQADDHKARVEEFLRKINSRNVTTDDDPYPAYRETSHSPRRWSDWAKRPRDDRSESRRRDSRSRSRGNSRSRRRSSSVNSTSDHRETNRDKKRKKKKKRHERSDSPSSGDSTPGTKKKRSKASRSPSSSSRAKKSTKKKRKKKSSSSDSSSSSFSSSSSSEDEDSKSSRRRKKNKEAKSTSDAKKHKHKRKKSKKSTKNDSKMDKGRVSQSDSDLSDVPDIGDLEAKLMAFYEKMKNLKANEKSKSKKKESKKSSRKSQSPKRNKSAKEKSKVSPDKDQSPKKENKETRDSKNPPPHEDSSDYIDIFREVRSLSESENRISDAPTASDAAPVAQNFNKSTVSGSNRPLKPINHANSGALTLKTTNPVTLSPKITNEDTLSPKTTNQSQLPPKSDQDPAYSNKSRKSRSLSKSREENGGSPKSLKSTDRRRSKSPASPSRSKSREKHSRAKSQDGRSRSRSRGKRSRSRGRRSRSRGKRARSRSRSRGRRSRSRGKRSRSRTRSRSRSRLGRRGSSARRSRSSSRSKFRSFRSRSKSPTIYVSRAYGGQRRGRSYSGHKPYYRPYNPPYGKYARYKNSFRDKYSFQRHEKNRSPVNFVKSSASKVEPDSNNKPNSGCDSALSAKRFGKWNKD